MTFRPQGERFIILMMQILLAKFVSDRERSWKLYEYWSEDEQNNITQSV